MKRVTTVEEFPDVRWCVYASRLYIDGVLQALIASDIGDFRVLDDRGGNGGWLIIVGSDYDYPDIEKALRNFSEGDVHIYEEK